MTVKAGSGHAVKLIDRVLVEVKVKPENNDMYSETPAGLLIRNEEANKAVNFGKVLAVAHHVSDERSQDLAPLIGVGDVVFFSSNKSYNFIPQSDDSVKLLMVPLWDVDAIVPKDSK